MVKAKRLPTLEVSTSTIRLGLPVYDNEITSLIDIYFLRISFIPSDLFRYFIYVTYSIDK